MDGLACKLRLGAILLCVVLSSAACSSGEGGRLESAAPPSSEGEVSVAADSGDAAFCTKVVDVLARYKDAFTDPTGSAGTGASDPQAALGQVKVMGQRLAPAIRELADAAPAPVAPALEEMAGGFETMSTGDLATLGTLSAQMSDASEQFGNYLAQHCQGTDIGGLAAITGAFGTQTQQAPAAAGTGSSGSSAGQSPAPTSSGSGERGPYAPPSPGR